MEENQKFQIIEVYESNFISEIKKISLYLKSYKIEGKIWILFK